eukprot:m.331983 g.331983  ORF g.331983 m.331983 type:complete len:54 (-) comp16836_c0_seq1:262-423(-)
MFAPVITTSVRHRILGPVHPRLSAGICGACVLWMANRAVFAQQPQDKNKVEKR